MTSKRRQKKFTQPKLVVNNGPSRRDDRQSLRAKMIVAHEVSKQLSSVLAAKAEQAKRSNLKRASRLFILAAIHRSHVNRCSARLASVCVGIRLANQKNIDIDPGWSWVLSTLSWLNYEFSEISELARRLDDNSSEWMSELNRSECITTIAEITNIELEDKKDENSVA